MGQSSRPVTPFELDNEILLPPPLPGVEDASINNHNQERCSPSPEIDHFNGRNPLSPPRASPTSNLDDIDPEIDGPGEDPPPSDVDEDSPSDEDEEERHDNDIDNEDDPMVTWDDMKIMLQFIRMLKEADLGSQFSPDELETFRNPQAISSSPSDDPDLLLSISNYVANLNASQDIYIKNHLNIQQRFPGVNILSYNQVERRVSGLTGGRGGLIWQAN